MNTDEREQLRAIDPKLAAVLDGQDQQFAQIQAAENLFNINNNVDELIAFWEKIWANGGLRFNGSRWTFRLPDLYIKSKRYNDALSLLDKITKPEYQVKAKKYRERITKRISK